MLLKYRQAVTPFLLSLVALAAVWASTGSWNVEEWATLLTGVILTHLSFFQANVPGWMWLKALIPAITVNIAVVTEWARTGTFDAKLWIPMAVAVVTAVLNLGLPNAPGAETHPINGTPGVAGGGPIVQMRALVPQPRRLLLGASLLVVLILALA